MTRDEKYWAERKAALLAQMDSDEQKLFKKLDLLYAKEAAKLEREIAAYYAQYGEKNVIQYRKLLASLSAEDVSLLMEKMEEFGKKYPQYAHLLPVRESIYVLNELEAVQLSMRIQQLEIGAIEQDELKAHFDVLAQRAANLAAEQMGFGSNFYAVNAQLVTATVGAAWSQGKAYSERIWENREKLATYLNDDFAKLIARGIPYDQCVKELSERFDHVSKSDIRRLIYTEGTFLFNEAQAQVHETEFEFCAISCADSRACKICKDLQREQRDRPIRISERKPGVNFPPMHPWCRCSYTIEVDDWDAWIDAYVEARGGDGLTAERNEDG